LIPSSGSAFEEFVFGGGGGAKSLKKNTVTKIGLSARTRDSFTLQDAESRMKATQQPSQLQ